MVKSEHLPVGKQFAQVRGGVNQALQDFIDNGKGSTANLVMILVVLLAVLFGYITGFRSAPSAEDIKVGEQAGYVHALSRLLVKLLLLSTLACIQTAMLILLVDAFEPLHQGVFLPVTLECLATLLLTTLASMIFGLLVAVLVPSKKG